jgi:hypothetical protein
MRYPRPQLPSASSVHIRWTPRPLAAPPRARFGMLAQMLVSLAARSRRAPLVRPPTTPDTTLTWSIPPPPSTRGWGPTLAPCGADAVNPAAARPPSPLLVSAHDDPLQWSRLEALTDLHVFSAHHVCVLQCGTWVEDDRLRLPGAPRCDALRPPFARGPHSHKRLMRAVWWRRRLVPVRVGGVLLLYGPSVRREVCPPPRETRAHHFRTTHFRRPEHICTSNSVLFAALEITRLAEGPAGSRRAPLRRRSP